VSATLALPRELDALAEDLDLFALREKLPELLVAAEKAGTSYTDFAVTILRVEAEARQNRRLDRNRKRSRLPPTIEGLESFDFSLRPQLEARVVRELLNCRWLEEGRNLICVGRPGLGKTRVLDALAEAALKTRRAVFRTTAAEMLEDLQGSLAEGSYRRTFRRYTKPAVLYLDEFGYAPFDTKATNHLFRVVAARHEARAPLLLAANTGFKNWKTFFPSEAQAVATVDRLIDRATILRFTGKSFRKPQDVLGAETDE
jgi:DNA replication protein DnaC